MERKKQLRYPIGDQSFLSVRTGNFLYVDKSMYIEKLLNGSQYYFLSRPRRFGKSLFLSMLKFFFEGRRDLFKGLYADTIEWDWHPRPVIYLDFNTRQYSSDEDIDRLLNQFLTEHENKFGIKNQSEDYSARFANLIRTMAEKTGYNVIILVDEYDKPLVNNINNPERLELFRNTLASLYSNFKSSADYLQMVFLTGVSRFGKLSVFSGLNNISDISFDRRFDAICGITRDELIDNFRHGIEELAHEQGSTFETELTKLQQWYDGYHFTQKCPDLYNPFSILNALSKKMYGNYWISSGTPTLLVEQLKRRHSDLEKLLTSRCGQSDLEGLDIYNIQPLPLFYQTGYLTIKSYDSKYDIYTLGIPNEEVKRGFFEYILPFYGNLNGESTRIFVVDFQTEMENGEVEAFMKRLQSFFAGISYEMRLDEERNVQNALLILFRLIGMHVEVEYHTSDGRIDILVRTKKYIYIIELKYDGSSEEALDQIKRKEYKLPWSSDNRKIISIGINYSTNKRRIDDWKAE